MFVLSSAVLLRLALTAIALPLAPRRIDPARVADVVEWVAEAAEAEEATTGDAAIAVVFAVHESAGRADARSSDGRDCSIVQLRGVALDGHTCAELAADPVLAVRLWLRYLARARARCGSTSAALGVLAAGRCGGAPRLVASRLALARIVP